MRSEGAKQMRRSSSIAALAMLAAGVLAAQAPASACNGRGLAARVEASLVRGQSISQTVFIEAEAVRAIGPDSWRGVARIEASEGARVRVELPGAAGPFVETRQVVNGEASGAAGEGGASRPRALHNLLGEWAWFFPALLSTSQPASPAFCFDDLGAGSFEGEPALHLAISRLRMPSGVAMPAWLAPSSRADLYLDPQTLLPRALVFVQHPDSDMEVAIPVEVRYSDYRVVQGVQLPFHIERFYNGVRQVTLDVIQCNLNTAAPAGAGN